MFKKTLISLAVASSVGLTGCFDSGSTGANANPTPNYTISEDSLSAQFEAKFADKVYPVFDPRPAISALPIPNDLIFGSVGDGSFTVANPDNNPVIAALNGLSGASTTAPIDIRMSGQIDDLDAATLAQNVILLETVYASGEPLRGLSAVEPPTVSGPAAIDVEIKELRLEDGTTTDFIRILPLEPLKPNTRYIVAINKGITSDGNPIVSSPQYTVLKDSIQDPNYPEINDDNTTVGPGLTPIVSLINGLWEPVVANALTGGQGTDAQIEAVRANIALAYSFTTSNDEKVLTYIANPATWFADQLKALVTTTAAKKIRGAQLYFLNQLGVEGIPGQPVQTWDLNEDGAVTAADFEPFSLNPPSSFMLSGDPNPANFGYEDVNLAVQGALLNFVPSEAEDLATLSPLLTQAGCDEAPDKFACTGKVAAGAARSLGAEFPQPASQAEALDIVKSTPATQRSAVLASVIDGEDETKPGVTIHEGSITLPYYLGTPVGGDTSLVQSSFWKADSALASLLKKSFGFDLAQADPTSSTVVNSIFPFPEQTTTQTVPIIVMTAEGVTPEDLLDDSEDLKVVMFQHGITTDRSAALGFGSALINNSPGDLVVVAIDQPLHGIGPFSTEDQQELADTLLTGAADALGPLGSLATPTEGRIEGVIDGTFVVSFTRNLAIASGFPDFTSSQAQELIALITGQITSTDDPVVEGLASDTSVQQAVGSILAIQGTVARAGSTIPGIDSMEGIDERHFNLGTNDANQVVSMSFDPENPVGESGDLFINLTGFLNSRDNLRQGAVDLMNVRKTIANLGGVDQSNVFFVGHSLGTVNGTSFVSAAADSGDRQLDIAATHLLTPASGIVRMLENSPSFAPTILAGLSQGANLRQGDANLESYFNVLQAAIDSTDPINFADNLVLNGQTVILSQVEGDRTTIAAAYDGFGSEPWEVPFSVNIGGVFPISSSQAPLAGSLPLVEQLQLTAEETFFAYGEGAHSTPVLPREVVTEAPDFEKFEFDFLKNRTLSLGDDVITTGQDAGLTFQGMVLTTLDEIYPPQP